MAEMERPAGSVPVESEPGDAADEAYRRLFESHPAAMAIWDPATGRILAANEAASKQYGYAPEDLRELTVDRIVHPDDLPRLQAELPNLPPGLAGSATFRHVRRSGEIIEVEMSGHPLDWRGRPARLVMAIDVTDRRRLEQELRSARAIEAVGRLAGGIAHDFNNLLTAISGYAELILMDFDAGAVPSRDSAEQIARAAGRAASLTAQLLAFSRKQVLRPQVIDLNMVVGGMATMVARMLGEDVILSTELDPGAASTLADPTQVEQVVLNLALNARDAMPDGGSLVIRTAPFELGEHDERPHPDLEPGSYVTLSVCDTGVGIEPELIETVFEPFFTTKAVGEGTGLGLATVHGIVSQSGGVIWVESTPGEGTTFTVCLPLAPQSEQSSGGE